MKSAKSLNKMALAGMFIALSVVGSLFSFPILGSRCAPIQHMVNVISAVLLGPWYAVTMALISSILRNILGLGTFMAFPGSICGALLAGIFYKFKDQLFMSCIGELVGTSFFGGLLAYPVAYFIMGNESAAIFGYIVPFLISSVGGVLIAIMIITALKKTKIIDELA